MSQEVSADTVRQIRDVLERYFSAIDARRFEWLHDVFTKDAIGDWTGGPGVAGSVMHGADSIVERISNVSRFAASTHVFGNSAIEQRSPDECHAVTEAVAYLAASGISRIFVRGVRYIDRFVLTDAGWRISHRVHEPRWQYSQDAETADLPTEV